MSLKNEVIKAWRRLHHNASLLFWDPPLEVSRLVDAGVLEEEMVAETIQEYADKVSYELNTLVSVNWGEDLAFSYVGRSGATLVPIEWNNYKVRLIDEPSLDWDDEELLKKAVEILEFTNKYIRTKIKFLGTYLIRRLT